MNLFANITVFERILILIQSKSLETHHGPTTLVADLALTAPVLGVVHALAQLLVVPANSLALLGTFQIL